MSMEIKALKSILAIKGLELPTDVEAVNPVSEFVSKQFEEIFQKDNEMLTILRDLFVERTNNEPLKTLQVLQRLNHAIVNFSMKDETKAYIKGLNADPIE